jgi:glucuronokinase
VIYCFRRETLPRVQEYLDRTPDVSQRTIHSFAKWLIESANVVVSGMRVPTHFKLVPRSSGLAAYSKVVKDFRQRSEEGLSTDLSMTPLGPKVVTERTHSRVGLMGNPSDGFGGKTIALLCSNFWAEVTIRESTRLRLIPHPLNDPNECVHSLTFVQARQEKRERGMSQ